jgi:hypothetical protein
MEFYFNGDKQRCKILYNEKLPPKLYIQISCSTDDHGCCCSHGSYYHTVPLTVFLNKKDAYLSSEYPLKKYVYDDYYHSYTHTKDIYYDRIVEPE